MKKKFSVSVNKKIEKFNKKVEIPGDKSCSIRALLFASQCIGESKIYNLLESTDCLDCLKALRVLGVKIIKRKKYYSVYGNGLNSFKIKKKINSYLYWKFYDHWKAASRTYFYYSCKILPLWRRFSKSPRFYESN